MELTSDMSVAPMVMTAHIPAGTEKQALELLLPADTLTVTPSLMSCVIAS